MFRQGLPAVQSRLGFAWRVHTLLPCPGNTYAAAGASVCTPCRATSALFPGSTRASQCIAFACSAYLIPASGLVGLDSACQPGEYVCTTVPCAVGFTWADISIFPIFCSTQTITSITIDVVVGVNCNDANFAAQATLNRIPRNAALDTGPVHCGCGLAATSEGVTLSHDDLQAYVVQGQNTITFGAPAQLGFYTYTDNAYARVIVYATPPLD